MLPMLLKVQDMPLKKKSKQQEEFEHAHGETYAHGETFNTRKEASSAQVID